MFSKISFEVKAFFSVLAFLLVSILWTIIATKTAIMGAIGISISVPILANIYFRYFRGAKKSTTRQVDSKVRIKSLEWYNTFKGEDGTVDVKFGFTDDMREFCGMTATIKTVETDEKGNIVGYRIAEDGHAFLWTEEMFDK